MRSGTNFSHGCFLRPRDDLARGGEHYVLVLKFFAQFRGRFCFAGDLDQLGTVQLAGDHREVRAVQARRVGHQVADRDVLVRVGVVILKYGRYFFGERRARSCLRPRHQNATER